MTAPVKEPLRLSKRVIELTGCSRSEADGYIENGWVTVDGQVVEEPQFKVTDETVRVDPEAKATPAAPATMLLHKPAGHDAGPGPASALTLLTEAARWSDDRSDIRMLKRHSVRLVPALPLEASASGLQIYSQDDRVLRRLRDVAVTIEQEYIVEVRGTPGPDLLRRLGHGLNYQGRVLPRAKVSWQSENKLRFAIMNVEPGQLSHMCSVVGLELVASRRIRIGSIALGKMPVGAWRYLPTGTRF